MSKFLIASDSFKGTLSTFDTMNLFAQASKKVFPETEVVKVPVSDGGDGFLSALFYLEKGTRVEVETFDANHKPIVASYEIDGNGEAYLECASCLFIADPKERNPFLTTSYGVGVLLLDAIRKGCKKIYLALGGTSTNDFGIGLLVAMGLKCFNQEGDEFLPTGGTLDQIMDIDDTNLKENAKGVEFIGLYDVDAPLLGKHGCSLMFSKQKGTDISGTRTLEKKMTAFHSFLLRKGYCSVAETKGAGAAGGIGGGILSFLKGKLVSGIDFYLDRIHFNQRLEGVDIVFTGEGKVDAQTLEGKVVAGILKRAKAKEIPVVAICGAADRDGEKLLSRGLSAIVTTGRNSVHFEQMKRQAGVFYYHSCLNALSLVRLGVEMKK